ncbi:efflux transporter periplasmic adaptor subunit [Cohaesibacter celericrescens]|uniref:Efflux transporter periplasmic adaptor subunit n=2 Tax=Cohaesibacter celericrescens TaxID=2067669 RepID=A0A2N5XMV4_9HYPH|nr:efflux transporter periplasmic adaptor subunit [Cohaesibacter celericrescens]
MTWPNNMTLHHDPKSQAGNQSKASNVLEQEKSDENAAHDPEGKERSVEVSTMLKLINWFFKLLLPFLVIGGGAFVAWNLVSTKPQVDRRPPSEKTYAVQVSPAKRFDHQPNIILYGTVSAARNVDLRALVSGEVIWVSPELVEGRNVQIGQALVRIDPFDYEGAIREAQANLAEAKAKLTETSASIASDEAALQRLLEQQAFARSDLERAEKLAKSGSLTRQALEGRKLILSQRQQSVEARENNLIVLKARIEQQDANVERLVWRLEQARRNLADTTLKAPFTGLVQSRSVDLGRSVSGNDTLVSLYDPDQMDVRFTLSDTQYGRLISKDNKLVGRKINVNWKLGDVVQSHQAIIERVAPEVNAANGGIEVYARVAEGSRLRTGTFVELVVPDKIYKDTIEVPQAALYGGSRVYINRNGRMQPQDVSVMAYLGDTVLIDGTVFEPATEIITTRVAEAGPGLKLVVPGREKQSASDAKGQNMNSVGGKRATGEKSKAARKEPVKGVASPPNNADQEAKQ